MVQIKIAASALVAIASFAPILALPIDIETDLVARSRALAHNHLSDSSALSQQRRELDEDELFARNVESTHHHPHGHHDHHGPHGPHAHQQLEPPLEPEGATGGSGASPEGPLGGLERRDFDEDELFARHVLPHGHQHQGPHSHAAHEVAPGAPGAHPHAAPPVGSGSGPDASLSGFERREFDELFARDHHPHGSKHLHQQHAPGGSGSTAAGPDPSAPVDLERREFDEDELFARDHHPHGSKHLHQQHAPGGSGSTAAGPDPSAPIGLERREYDEDELFARGDHDDHKRKDHKNKRHSGDESGSKSGSGNKSGSRNKQRPEGDESAPAENLSGREFDEDELFARNAVDTARKEYAESMQYIKKRNDERYGLARRELDEDYLFARQAPSTLGAASDGTSEEEIPPRKPHKHSKGKKKPSHLSAHPASLQTPEKLSRRDFEDIADELLEREDLETLLARYFEDLD